MYERFADLGVDMAEDPVEVAPTSHYGTGGVAVDDTGEADVDGLFAIGETMAGVHGANRLGGNSLAETVAFGTVAGRTIADRAPEAGHLADSVIDTRVKHILASLSELTENDGTYDVEAVFNDLQSLMWDHAGLLRDEAAIQQGLDKLATVREKTTDLDVGARTDESFEFAIDLEFMLVAAETVLQGALQRTESRGAHYRTDHPEVDPSWQRNILFTEADLGRMTTDTRPVDSPSDQVQAALNEGHELDYHQLE